MTSAELMNLIALIIDIAYKNTMTEGNIPHANGNWASNVKSASDSIPCDNKTHCENFDDMAMSGGDVDAVSVAGDIC